LHSAVSVKTAPIFNESQLLELVHEKIYTRASSPNHRC
jgi:hypothetical protein